MTEEFPSPIEEKQNSVNSKESSLPLSNDSMSDEKEKEKEE